MVIGEVDEDEEDGEGVRSEEGLLEMFKMGGVGVLGFV